MAKSNSERQAEYRARRINAGPEGQGDRRINGWISTEADLALDRLARHHGISRRAMLEKLITNADNAVQNELQDAEFEAYIRPVTR